MIGQCKHCGDPSAELKLNKKTDQVICSNRECMKVKEDATTFFKKALRDQRDYLSSNETVAGNTLHCGDCGVNTPSVLLKRSLVDGASFKQATNEQRYLVQCSICSAEKTVSGFMLNALIETLNAQQHQVI